MGGGVGIVAESLRVVTRITQPFGNGGHFQRQCGGLARGTVRLRVQTGKESRERRLCPTSLGESALKQDGVPCESLKVWRFGLCPRIVQTERVCAQRIKTDENDVRSLGVLCRLKIWDRNGMAIKRCARQCQCQE